MEMYRLEFMEGLQNKFEESNLLAWRIGQYMIPAIQMAINPKKAKYPNKPYGLDSDDEQMPAEIQAIKFEEWANVFNKKFETTSQIDSA